MGPTWVLSAPDGPHVGPMNSAVQIPKSWVARQTTHGGCLGGPYYFGWSVYAVVRNDDEPLISLLCHHQGIYLKILLSLEGTRFLFKVLQSFWNLTGGSAPMLPSRLSTFKVIGLFFPNCTQLSNGKKSVGNSLVTKRTTQGTSMGCPFHLWVTFGDRVTVFGQHCMNLAIRGV